MTAVPAPAAGVSTELLAPARDLECGRAAIDCGADAVYIGAPRFGARAAAGNTLTDIEALARHAHRYWARVYVTLNTLLRDDELPAAVALARRLHELGADGLIIQDVGLLECDLPPLPLLASTQMHNHTPARVAFLEQVGFRRVILARELDLDQIRAIRAATTLELEFFVHGALCVCYSGQCYMSHAIGGRSGNRGECAQPCRRPYDLVDGTGRTLAADRHLLSLRDLNLSHRLDDLLAVGITSFKIEGRLKDAAYVRNVVTHYRRRLDACLTVAGMSRSSSGITEAGFTPDVDRTFNRGFTEYYLDGGRAAPAVPETPKMTGERLGAVEEVGHGWFELRRAAALTPGDGLCYFDPRGQLRGFAVHAVEGRRVYADGLEGLQPGAEVSRNRDHAFLREVSRAPVRRRIPVRLRLEETAAGLALEAEDGDGNRGRGELEVEKAPARQPERVREAAARQLTRTGDSDFAVAAVELAWSQPWFLPLSALNELRRRALESLARHRADRRPVAVQALTPNDAPFPEPRLTFLGNALNHQAVAFYRRHGAEVLEPAAESGLDLAGRQVMRTRYCVRGQLGLCLLEDGGQAAREPLHLVDEDGHPYRLAFHCDTCEMSVYY
ncbi:MAG: U32 family peptidase [Gemmatimonadota bacterium]